MFAIKSFNNSFRGQRKLSSSNAFFNLTNYDLNKENDRLRTFSENNCNLTNIKDLAIVGYYYIQSPDVVKCQFCYVVQHVAETNNSVICNHLRVSPNCPLLRRRITLNQPVSEDELNEILPPER